MVSEETVLRRLAALALGKEARAGGERAAAREALASALERRPGGLGGRVRAALEREAAADWAAELTTDRGSGEERLAAKRLLRALIQTGWGAAGICGHPEALRLSLADREAALPALEAASAPGADLYGPIGDDERARIEAARPRIQAAVAEAQGPAPQVAAMEL